MSDLLARLKAGRALRREVWLGAERLLLRPLVESERQLAQIAANEAMAAAGVVLSAETVELFDAELATQVLRYAVLDPLTDAPLFADGAAARDTLLTVQKSVLLAAYAELERDACPRPGVMPEREFEALLETVKKTPQTTLLNDSSGDTLRRLIASLASPPSI